MKQRAKKWMTWSIAGLLLVAGATGYYIYKEYNRKLPDTASLRPDQSLTATDLISRFETNDSLAGKQFLDKVIEVNGTVKEIVNEEGGLLTLALGDTASMSSVRCTVDSSHSSDFRSVVKGSQLLLKGVCTGFNRDELLGSDVMLVRCVISKNSK